MSTEPTASTEVYDLQQERIDREAADWFVRRSEGDHAVTDAAFFDWLAKDERHGRTYDEIAAVYEAIGEVDAAGSSGAAPRTGWLVPRRLAAGGALAASLAALAFFATMPPQQAVTYRTDTGETRELSLADGSIVTLGPRTRLDTRIDGDRREVEIVEGAAFFSVAHDSRRPFLVDAGGAEVKVVGTRFEVHRQEEVTAVLVEQGRVEVKDRYAIGLVRPMRVLRAGEATSVASDGPYLAFGAPDPELRQIAVQDVATWRGGHLIYTNQQLGTVVRDLGRYYGPGVQLADPSLESLRITASFAVADIQEFVTALSETFPVAVTREADGTLVVAPRR